MAELRLMENCDIEGCTELYLGAFHHDGKMGGVFSGKSSAIIQEVYRK